MSHTFLQQKRILSIDPTIKGFGFAVMEGRDNLIDWGVKETKEYKDKKDFCLQQITNFINRYLPDAIVVEDINDSRRCIRVQGLIKDIQELVNKRNITVYSFSRERIREVFLKHNVQTKHEIAKVIAKQFPELSSRLPPYRKPWMPEDYRMSIFDAVSFGLTYFHYIDY